ncbi:MAG TPA: hypothetical protein PKE40_03000 [Arachnia sp.]|nr:hypothetical protein [Arachnia sp.]HMT85297.1 hypothetical protein [Arachnia sp.]
MPTRHRLTIGALDTRVRAAPGTAQEWAQHLDEAMRGPLPRALGVALERRFEGRDDVIRIRRLRVNWRLGAERFDPDGLADELSRRIAERLAEAVGIGGPGAAALREEVRIWPDHRSYVAAWLRHRLGVERDAEWAFPDFASLNVLTGPEAAAEVMVVAGPSPLIGLARSDSEALTIARLLGEAAALRIVAALAEQAGPRAIEAGSSVLRGEPRSAVDVLALVLRPDDAVTIDEPRLRGAARVLLARLAVAGLVRDGWSRSRILGFAAAAAPSALLPGSIPEPARAALAACAADPGVLARLLPRGDAEPAVPGEGADAGPPEPALVAARVDGIVSSPFAGLALALSFCPVPLATPETIRRIALDLVPEENRPAAALDAGFATLFPADPRLDPTEPPPPPEEAWSGAGTLAGAPRREGFARHADLWLARFAAALAGLRDSSRGYLAREFLLRSGTIELGEDLLHVRLAPMPLGIVPRMSGLTGLGPFVVHLRRRVLIDLEAG